MSKIISLIGQRFVLASRAISCHVNQTSQFSSVVLQHNLAQYTTRPTTKGRTQVSSKRFLYEPSSLGIGSLEHHRANKSQLYERDREGYVSRMNKYLEDPETRSILLEDLINMIGLAQDEKHLDLIEKMVININNYHNFPLTGWGTAVMRLYYTMDQTDRAYNNIKNIEKFGQFFNSYSAYRITMTMLFNKGQYDRVLDIYCQARTIMKTENGQNQRNNHGLAVVALAAIAKQNNSDGFEKAQEIYQEVADQDCNKFFKLRLTSFMSYIALNSNQPSVALNLISEAPARNYISLREIKAIALLNLRRYEDVLYHIRESLVKGSQVEGERRPILHQDTYDKIKSKEQDIDDEVIKNELMETLDELKRSKLIADGELNSVVFAPIILKTSDPSKKKGHFDAPQEYNRRQNRGKQNM